MLSMEKVHCEKMNNRNTWFRERLGKMKLGIVAWVELREAFQGDYAFIDQIQNYTGRV